MTALAIPNTLTFKIVSTDNREIGCIELTQAEIEGALIDLKILDRQRQQIQRIADETREWNIVAVPKSKSKRIKIQREAEEELKRVGKTFKKRGRPFGSKNKKKKGK